jgi:hypothetical protein
VPAVEPVEPVSGDGGGVAAEPVALLLEVPVPVPLVDVSVELPVAVEPCV